MPKERALIEIRLAGLSQGVHEFDFACTAGDFNDTALTDAGFTGEISVGVTVDKYEDEITVSIETSASADRTCDLCLAPVSLDLEGSYHIYYVYDLGQEIQEARDEEDEYRLIDRNTVSVNLTEEVRETLLLSVPMKVTCTDNPDCQVFQQEPPEETDSAPDSSWQESLEKLKNKYR
ncbi:MAG: DUF177 domain-containing protein [Chlorobiaceae bacterium]|nr:DUF177 domain-containing protein [Chlorobiaceae bacterium]